MRKNLISEAFSRNYSVKIVLLKILQKSQETTLPEPIFDKVVGSILPFY